MPKKIENNFYDRFMALKPKGLSDTKWFAKFGWTGNKMHKKCSDWPRIEFPGPKTVQKIHEHFPLTAEQMVTLILGTVVNPIKTLPAGGGAEPATVAGGSTGDKRGSD